ncbi:MAG: hypothetical protein WBW31_09485 [Candidatus Sulfotelmatobacter sp.]
MGGRVGLGGEDGRSCGGAVSFFAVSRRLGRTGLVSVLMVSFGLACSRQNGPAPPDAATLLQAVAAADPAKYPSLQETRHWSNPYLVIRPEAVGLLTSITANEERILKPEEVLDALARLPASAWPYGRAVAILVDEKPTASEADKIAIRRNRGIVAGDLEGAHVAIDWISTP